MCYNCQKPRHFVRDCKVPKVEPFVKATRATCPTAKGRVFCMTIEEATHSSDLIQGNCDSGELQDSS